MKINEITNPYLRGIVKGLTGVSYEPTDDAEVNAFITPDQAKKLNIKSGNYKMSRQEMHDLDRGVIPNRFQSPIPSPNPTPSPSPLPDPSPAPAPAPTPAPTPKPSPEPRSRSSQANLKARLRTNQGIGQKTPKGYSKSRVGTPVQKLVGADPSGNPVFATVREYKEK